jgi:hypothetical protein
VRRREFIAVLAGKAVLGSHAALSQQPARLPRLAIASPISQTYPTFFEELARLGYEAPWSCQFAPSRSGVEGSG